jgi:hypothetical protein
MLSKLLFASLHIDPGINLKTRVPQTMLGCVCDVLKAKFFTEMRLSVEYPFVHNNPS